MKKFEYKTIHFKFGIGKSFENKDEELNKLGLEGWECVNAYPNTAMSNTSAITYLFKREFNN